MHDIFAPVALSGKVCDLNTVGSVNVVSLDMISTPPFPRWVLIISHCPWVNNCVGVRTHRSFVTYVTLLLFGIPIFVYLAYLRMPPHPSFN